MAYISELKDALANGFHVIIVQQWDQEFAFFVIPAPTVPVQGQGYL